MNYRVFKGIKDLLVLIFIYFLRFLNLSKIRYDSNIIKIRLNLFKCIFNTFVYII